MRILRGQSCINGCICLTTICFIVGLLVLGFWGDDEDRSQELESVRALGSFYTTELQANLNGLLGQHELLGNFLETDTNITQKQFSHLGKNLRNILRLGNNSDYNGNDDNSDNSNDNAGNIADPPNILKHTAWAPLVWDRERIAFERRAESDLGNVSLPIHDINNERVTYQEYYFPIRYITPLRDSNHHLLMLDLLSEPVRNSTVNRSLEMGSSSVSGIINGSVLLMLPVMDTSSFMGENTHTLGTIRGFLNLLIGVDTLLEAVMKLSYQGSLINLRSDLLLEVSQTPGPKDLNGLPKKQLISTFKWELNNAGWMAVAEPGSKESLKIVDSLQVAIANKIWKFDMYLPSERGTSTAVIIFVAIIGIVCCFLLIIFWSCASYLWNKWHLKEMHQQQKDQFISYIFHEIRVPLNTIKIGVHNLRDRNLNQRQTATLDIVQNSLKQTTLVLNDILDLNKIENGKFDINLNFMNIERFLINMVLVFETVARDRQLKFTYDLDPALRGKEIRVDETRITQCINNLLSNAFKYTPEGTVHLTIQVQGGDAHENRSNKSSPIWGFASTNPFPQRVKHFFRASSSSSIVEGTPIGSCSEESDLKSAPTCESLDDHIAIDIDRLHGSSIERQIQFIVKDTGIGISKENRAKLFKPYVQINNDTSEIGTGLGLVIARQMAKLHGGGIQLESALGDGSKFTLFIKSSVRSCNSSTSLEEGLQLTNVNSTRTRHRRGRHSSHKSYSGSKHHHRHTEPLPHGTVSADSTTLSAVSHIELDPDADADPDLDQDHDLSKIKKLGLHFMIVDDNKGNCFVLRDFLERLGIKVTTCVNGKLAVDEIARVLDGTSEEIDKMYDLIFMDKHMPEMDGIEATTKIREMGVPITILGLTGISSQSEKDQFIKAGITDILIKPLDLIKFRKTILETFITNCPKQ